jgi:hypothetical protein
MRDKRLIEDNRLIAEFMGRSSTCDIWDTDSYRGEICLIKGLDVSDVDAEISHFEDRYGVTCEAITTPLEYHTSWDWLMPVVKKCLRESKDRKLGWEGIMEYAVLTMCDRRIAYAQVVKFIKAQKK